MAGEQRSFWVYFKGDLGDLQSKTRAAKQELRQAQADIQATMRNIGRGMTVVGGAIVGTLGYAIKETAEFENAMSAAASLGIDDLGTLRDGVRETAASYGLDLVPAAWAAYDTVSGLTKDAAEATLFLESAAKAAATGQTDLQTSAKLGVNVISAFGATGEDAVRIYDELFTAVNAGITTFPELAASVGDVASTFSQAGLSSAEMVAAISALTLAGNKTTKSTTQLRAALNNIIKPSEDARAVAKALEIDFSAAGLKAQGFDGFLKGLTEAIKTQGPELEALREKLGAQIDKMATAEEGTKEYKDMVKALKEEYSALEDMSGSQITMMSRLFGSIEGFNGMLGIAGNQAEALTRITEAATDATGTLDEAYRKFSTDNVQHNMGILMARIKDLRMEVAYHLLPTVSKLVEWLIETTKGVSEWVKENDKIVKGLTWFAAIAGGLMVTLGPLLIALPGIALAIKGIGGGIAALKTLGFVKWLSVAIGGSKAIGATGAGTAAAAAGGTGVLGLLGALIGLAAWFRIVYVATDRLMGYMYEAIPGLKDLIVDMLAELIKWGGLAWNAVKWLFGMNSDVAGSWRSILEGEIPDEITAEDIAAHRARQGIPDADPMSLASRVTSQGSGLARQARTMAPTFATAGAGSGGGGLNLNISFGDVRIREQADINRIADAITRRAYDMLAQRGIRR